MHLLVLVVIPLVKLNQLVRRKHQRLSVENTFTHLCFAPASITASLPHLRQSITSKPWILDKNERSLIKSMEGWVKVQEDTERMKYKSLEGIDEEEEDGDAVEIVTNTEEQMEAKEKNKKVPMNYLDEDVEVISGTVETPATELKFKTGDGSGKVMLVEDQKNGDVEDAGRRKSTNITDNVRHSSVQLIEELLGDVNDRASNKSGALEMIDFTREELSEDEIQPEDFEKNMHVQSTVSTQMLMDEEVFLNAKHEPVEWHQDEH